MEKQLIHALISAEEYRKSPDFMNVNLSDFALFLAVMKHKEAQECVLSIILDEPNLRLIQVRVEDVILNKNGKRGIRLDAWALAEDSRQFATEMQNDASEDDLRKRSRYYQGLLDTPALKAGKHTKYRHLPSTIVIFITQTDLFGMDRAMYTFTERCHQIPGMELGDETMKVFLNMSSKNERDELVSLLQYMKNSTLSNPEIFVIDDRIRRLDAIVTEVKQSEEWEDAQMSILSTGIDIGRRVGHEEGLEEGRKEGQLEGIHAIITVLKEHNLTDSAIIQQLCNSFHRGRVCQDTFCGFSKLNDLSVKKPPKASCLQMS
ncbi:MAG: Rpn family recombination-promoting nuclease/putative transposase [Clostridium sp.]